MIQAGELAGARIHLMEILGTAPNDPIALNLLGVVDAQEGQFGPPRTVTGKRSLLRRLLWGRT